MPKRLKEVNFDTIIISDSQDNKRGRTIVMRRQMVINGALGIAHLTPPTPPDAAGLISIDVRCDGGVATIDWTFQREYASEDRGGGVAREGGQSTRVYELDGSLSQEPITSHRRYAALLATYGIGERDGEPIWLEKDPTGQSQTTGLSSSGGRVESISPMYGVRDFLSPSAVYRYTKFYSNRGNIPGDLVSTVGKISEPEGLTEGEPFGRFLKIGAEIQQVGDAFRVTEQWMASQSSEPEGLWRDELYGGSTSTRAG